MCLYCCLSPSFCNYTVNSHTPGTPRFDPQPSRQLPTQAYSASTIIQADGVIVALVKLRGFYFTGTPERLVSASYLGLPDPSWLLSYSHIAWQTQPPPLKATGL